MPRAVRLTLLWLGTTALAVTVSWFGVRLVLYAAVPDRSNPLSVRDLKNASPRATGPRATGPPPAAGVTQIPSPSVRTSNEPAPVLQRWEDSEGKVNYQSTVSTDGGWAKIQWNSTKDLIIDTVAETGYTSKIQQQSDTRVTISFESSGKTATISAWWDDDEPKLDVDAGNR
jgi:hypothetical protein